VRVSISENPVMDATGADCKLGKSDVVVHCVLQSIEIMTELYTKAKAFSSSIDVIVGKVRSLVDVVAMLFECNC
jgi:hypothetical protein